MKQLTPRAMLIAFLLISFYSVHAQIVITNNYVFNYSQNFYTEIEEGVDSNLPSDWLDQNYDLAVIFPFEFEIFNQPIVGITSYYTPSLLYFVKEDVSDGNLPFLVPFGQPQLQNRINASQNGVLSDISTAIEGEIGQRIVKIQYRNVGFQEDIIDDGYSSDFVNFQLWFYEGSNAIEIHYGAYYVPNASVSFEGASGPTFGIFEIENATFDNGGMPNRAYFLANDPYSPQFMDEPGYFENSTLNNMPPTGMTYTLTPVSDTIVTTPSTTSTNDILWIDGIDIFPNPTADALHIKVKENDLVGASYSLTDTSGKTFFSGILLEEVQTLHLKGLAKGIYYLKLSKENKGVIKRVLVQ